MSKLYYTVDLFREDPETWNVRDPGGRIVAQRESQADAEGEALICDSHYRLGKEACDAELSALRLRVSDLELLVRGVSTNNVGIHKGVLSVLRNPDKNDPPWDWWDIEMHDGLPVFTDDLRSALSQAAGATAALTSPKEEGGG